MLEPSNLEGLGSWFRVGADGQEILACLIRRWLMTSLSVAWGGCRQVGAARHSLHTQGDDGEIKSPCHEVRWCHIMHFSCCARNVCKPALAFVCLFGLEYIGSLLFLPKLRYLYTRITPFSIFEEDKSTPRMTDDLTAILRLRTLKLVSRLADATLLWLGFKLNRVSSCCGMGPHGSGWTCSYRGWRREMRQR